MTNEIHPAPAAELKARVEALEAENAALIERAATTGYIVCAETRHVTLGEKVRAAIQALGGVS